MPYQLDPSTDERGRRPEGKPVTINVTACGDAFEQFRKSLEDDVTRQMVKRAMFATLYGSTGGLVE